MWNGWVVDDIQGKTVVVVVGVSLMFVLCLLVLASHHIVLLFLDAM